MIAKRIAYKPATEYLFPDQKRKLRLIQKIKNNIAKFELKPEDVGFAMDDYYSEWKTLVRRCLGVTATFNLTTRINFDKLSDNDKTHFNNNTVDRAFRNFEL